jgi:Transposase DDE domain
LRIVQHLKRNLLADKTREKYRVSDKNFTRHRVLTFTIIAVSILRGHKFSLQNALNKVFQALGKLRLTPTKSALCQARQKISPELFVYLHQTARDDFYQLYGEDDEVLTWRGHRVLAYDGTALNLPNTPDLQKAFSIQRNQKGAQGVQALAGVLYDVRNDIAIGAQLGPYQAEKNFLLNDLWSWTKPGDLIVMDRLFDDYAIISTAKRDRREVLIRCRRNSAAIIKEFAASEETERIVTLQMPKTSKTREYVSQNNLPESVTVRLIKFRLESGEVEVLLTTLCDRRRYPTAEFKEVYHWRWNEEGFFDRIKNIFEVERFSGFSEIAIKQDFFGVIFLATLESILTKGPQSELAEEDRRRRNKTQAMVNRSVSYVSLVDRAIQLLADPRTEPEEVLEELQFLFKRDPTRNLKDRKFERKKFNHSARLRFHRYRKRISA